MVLKDLSTTLVDALSAKGNADKLQKFRLSDQQIEHFHQFGYVAGIPVVDQETVNDLRGQLTELFDPNHQGKELWHEYHSNESADPEKTLFHALGAWRIKPAFHGLLWNPAWLVPASQLLEGSVRFWHDQLFCKPAKHGGNVAWHQDYSYWTRTKPLAHLTCWIGLDKVNQENGCLHYIPGSHNWELLPSTGLAGDMDAIRSVLDDAQWKQFQNPVPIELEAGECTFHHPLMVHGSFANESDRPRRGTVINVVRDGVESYTDDPLLNGVPIIPQGQPLGGQFFPLLYDAS